jgi:hypothetical protein
MDRIPVKSDLVDASKDDGAKSVVSAARERCEQHDWQGAYEQLLAAHSRGELDARGLELLAECTRFVGDFEQIVGFLESAHLAYGKDRRGAVRTALGLCHAHMDACNSAQSAAWWQRADELIAPLPESPEHGLHAWFAGRACGDQGDLEGHKRHAQRALEVGRRFKDRNIEALALIDLAHLNTVHGRTSKALELLDRATALALGGEIGILETGTVLCNAIFACRARGEWHRAQEWTESLNRWISRVQVSYFPGLCRVHRAEVFRIRGELAAAEAEASAAVGLLRTAIPHWIALAYIELGEIRRRRGNLAGSLEAYREALAAGWEPQPGLALLMLAQGDADGAHSALERFCKSRLPTLLREDRAGLLRARVSVSIAAGNLETASNAAEALSALAEEEDALPWDRASSFQAQGELALAQHAIADAIENLHKARTLWAEFEVPYELAACCRCLGRALAAESDHLGAKLELEAARGIFENIGATRDRKICDTLLEAPDRQSILGTAPRKAPNPVTDASLRREGDIWTIQFEGRTLRLKDGKGLRYLARLLAEPAGDLLALDLASDGQGAPGGDAGKLLDARARKAYRKRISELRAEMDEADRYNDFERSHRYRAEIEVLTSELSKAIGLGGRTRRAGAPAERARQSVTKALRGTIRRIDTEHPSLGRYLNNTIHTGTTCRFDPDPGRPIHWRVET